MDFDAGEIEFDDDFDSDDFSEEEYEEEIIEDNNGVLNDADEQAKAFEESSGGEENEDEEEDEDDEDEPKEVKSTKEVVKPKILNRRLAMVRLHKKDNIKVLGKLGTISYLCHIVNFIKRGGSMLDKQTEFDYPNETEESYAIKSILTSSTPFVHIVNNTKVEIDRETLIITLKQVLRAVHDDNKIFFTPSFTEAFPLFVKNLFNDSVSSEEWEEINKINGSV